MHIPQHSSLKHFPCLKIRNTNPTYEHFPDHNISSNLQQLTNNNTKCFIAPTAHTNHLTNSGFVKKIYKQKQ